MSELSQGSGDQPFLDRDPDSDPGQESLGPESLRRRLLAELGAADVPQTIRLDREPLSPPPAPHSDQQLESGREPGPLPSLLKPPSSLPSRPEAAGSDVSPTGLEAKNGTGSGEVKKVRPPYQLPEVGEQLFGFRLCGELGRGAFARVFLAEQADLAGRPVVLKVSAIEGSEPQTLAQLQHTHIVPIYSVHEYAEAGLRALCMPYFGGASLSAVLKKLGQMTPCPSQGVELLRALDDAATLQAAAVLVPSTGETYCLGGVRPPCPTGQTPRSVLAGFSFIRAAVWIVTRLAEGLEHAHQRGVLHRDIKPSNILIGGDGQPMLLDFNLAHSLAITRAQATLGGTIAYMSPEHLRALGSSRRTREAPIDQRSDVYSLGLVLYELLGGTGPFRQSGSYTPLPELVDAMALERGGTTPSLRRLRRDIPWSLESIIRRCLAPSPADRYQRAEHLAEDLRRFLDDRPLRHAPEPSLIERGQKWLRRSPRLASAAMVSAVACFLLLGMGLAAEGVKRQRDASQAGHRQLAYQNGTVRALFLINTANEQRDHLQQGLAVCRETLDLYQVLERDNWQEHPDWRWLRAEERASLGEDTRELLLLLAQGRARQYLEQQAEKEGTAAPEKEETFSQALALLRRAEAIPGLPPCRALWAQRADYLSHLGDWKGAEAARKRAEGIEVATARDHYLLAMMHTLNGKPSEAIKHLNESLRLDPRHYWSWMQRGLRHFDQRDYALAASDFGACVGLRPDFAWGYFNRAAALAECGHKAEAVADYTLALERDPDLRLAFFNRAMLHLELGQYQSALEDFQRCRELGEDDAKVHLGLGTALERLERPAQADREFAAVTERAVIEPPKLRHRLMFVYGFAVAYRLPRRAREAFEEVLRDDPTNAHALYGCAMLLDRKGQAREALTYFNRALEADPTLEIARRFRAILLARQGQFQVAYQEINSCLGRDQVPAATQYAAACVAALRARAEPRSAAHFTQEALRLLEQAFARGYGIDTASTDRDLDGIRKEPAFRDLLEKYRGAKKL